MKRHIRGWERCDGWEVCLQAIAFILSFAFVPFLSSAQEKAAPLAACIEPAALRTEAAQLLPGSKTTVIVPARPDEIGLLRLTKDEFAATGLKWEQFLKQAGTTAAAHLKTLKPDIQRDRKGTAQHAILKSEDHLTASVILCPEFFAQFRDLFGDRLVVLVPDRFTVYVFPRGFGDFQKMGPAILEQYEKSVWPCSREAFEITAEGLKCLGAFDSGGDESAGATPAPVAPEKAGKK